MYLHVHGVVMAFKRFYKQYALRQLFKISKTTSSTFQFIISKQGVFRRTTAEAAMSYTVVAKYLQLSDLNGRQTLGLRFAVYGCKATPRLREYDES